MAIQVDAIDSIIAIKKFHESYKIDDVVYSVAKLNGKIIENFIRKEQKS